MAWAGSPAYLRGRERLGHHALERAELRLERGHLALQARRQLRHAVLHKAAQPREAAAARALAVRGRQPRRRQLPTGSTST